MKESRENITIGKCIDISINRNLLEKHIQRIDRLMNRELENNGFSDTYFDLLEKRGINYLEYSQIFDHTIKEEDFLTYVSFLFIGVDSEYGYYDNGKYIYGRKDYIHIYSQTEKDYYTLLGTFPKFIAQFQKEKKQANLPYVRMWEHTYINGASGSGKSTLMKGIIYSLLGLDNSIILIDPQGTLSSDIRAFKKIATERIIYVKPTLKNNFIPTINFLENEESSNTNTMALRLARVVSILSNGELSSPMVALLRPCLAVLIEQGGFSLSDLKRFMDVKGNTDLVQLGLTHPDPEYQSTFKRINTGYFNKSRDAVMSKLDMVLQDSYFRYLTSGKSTIHLKSAIKKGKVIIFNLEGLDTDTIQAFGRLLVALILHIALERTSSTLENSKRIFLFIDEMQNFLTPDIIKILDEARQKKLHLVMANQRIGQLKSHIKTNMEENFIDAIIGNNAIKIVGHNDSPDTITTLSTKLGMDKEKLVTIPNYEFLLRVRGQKDTHFISSNDINHPKKYLSKKEVIERDSYMIRKYYKQMDNNNTKHKAQNELEEKEEKPNITSSKNIVLEDDDF